MTVFQMRTLIMFSSYFFSKWCTYEKGLCEKVIRNLGNKKRKLKLSINCINAETVTKVELVNFKN